jgi:anti-sigma-K factor RskA
MPQNQPPFRIGILASNKDKQILALSADAETLFKNVPRLAASLETSGQSATRPSSPYVLSGNCVKLW